MSDNQIPGASGKIADIEILRAFAVLFVVLHHATDNLFKPGQLYGGAIHQYFGGWVGVDLFFAISGFVIARTLLPMLESSTGNQQYRRTTYRFWGKRALRLLPSAWAWLAIILLLQIFFNDSGSFGTLRANIWATVAGVFNFANFRFASAFMNYEYGASFVYWSLSLEEQFYLVLPLLFFVSNRYLPLVLLVLIVVQLPQQRGPLEMVIRSDAISFGILIAIFSKRNTYWNLRPDISWRRFVSCRLALISGLILLPLLGSFSQQQLPIQIGMISVLSALLVFLCSFDANLLAGLPGARILVWLGSRSYAVYLIHIPAFFMVREVGFRLNFALYESQYAVLFLALVLILALAELNFHLLEVPARKISKSLFS